LGLEVDTITDLDVGGHEWVEVGVKGRAFVEGEIPDAGRHADASETFVVESRWVEGADVGADVPVELVGIRGVHPVCKCLAVQEPVYVRPIQRDELPRIQGWRVDGSSRAGSVEDGELDSK
jgi:hypothetical protein